MPSSHAAGVAALSTAVGTQFGFDSALFAVTLVFTLITLFDAQGVRRSSGRQARILNRMVEDMASHRPIQEARLDELLGVHRPAEARRNAGGGRVDGCLRGRAGRCRVEYDRRGAVGARRVAVVVAAAAEGAMDLAG